MRTRAISPATEKQLSRSKAKKTNEKKATAYSVLEEEKKKKAKDSGPTQHDARATERAKSH